MLNYEKTNNDDYCGKLNNGYEINIKNTNTVNFL